MAEKNLLLDSQFTTVCALWPPEKPDAVQTGTLVVDKNGIKFTAAPTFNRRISKANIRSEISFGGDVAARLPVLHGFTENGLCTLCQLVEIERPGRMDFASGQSLVAVSYRAALCVMGMHLGGVDDKCLDFARYTFTGLGEWLPKGTTESWEADNILIKVPFRDRAILAFGLQGSRTEVNLRVVSTLTNSESDDGRVSRSVPQVEVASAGAESVSWYRHIGNRLENLFSLLTGTSIALQTMFLYRGEDSGHIVERRATYAKRFDRLNCVHCSPNEMANSIAIWLSEPERFRSVENLALGVMRKGRLFLETEFLSLAQALEGFHRATTRSDISFRSRLTELRARIGGPLSHRMQIGSDEFLEDVVTTRNFYTHAGSDPQTGAKCCPTEGPQLLFLNQKMRALLRGVMLLHLGIPEVRLSDLLIREATRWH